MGRVEKFSQGTRHPDDTTPDGSVICLSDGTINLDKYLGVGGAEGLNIRSFNLKMGKIEGILDLATRRTKFVIFQEAVANNDELFALLSDIHECFPSAAILLIRTGPPNEKRETLDKRHGATAVLFRNGNRREPGQVAAFLKSGVDVPVAEQKERGKKRRANGQEQHHPRSLAELAVGSWRGSGGPVDDETDDDTVLSDEDVISADHSPPVSERKQTEPARPVVKALVPEAPPVVAQETDPVVPETEAKDPDPVVVVPLVPEPVVPDPVAADPVPPDPPPIAKKEVLFEVLATPKEAATARVERVLEDPAVKDPIGWGYRTKSLEEGEPMWGGRRGEWPENSAGMVSGAQADQLVLSIMRLVDATTRLVEAATRQLEQAVPPAPARRHVTKRAASEASDRTASVGRAKQCAKPGGNGQKPTGRGNHRAATKFVAKRRPSDSYLHKDDLLSLLASHEGELVTYDEIEKRLKCDRTQIQSATYQLRIDLKKRFPGVDPNVVLHNERGQGLRYAAPERRH